LGKEGGVIPKGEDGVSETRGKEVVPIRFHNMHGRGLETQMRNSITCLIVTKKTARVNNFLYSLSP
jgi:hypothetical protein